MHAENGTAVIEEYLGRLKSRLPIGRSADIVRELESSIRDRADDIAAREHRDAGPDDVRRAIAEIGEPDAVAGAYVTRRALIGPDDLRPFLTASAVLFAVHVSLVGVATTLGHALRMGPAEIAPLGPDGLVATIGGVMHALVFDVGLMLLVFAATGESRRRFAKHAFGRPVDTTPRAAAGRMTIALLAGVLLGVFRDRLFVVLSSGDAQPLFTEWFGAMLPLVIGLLALSVVSDALYLALGERRLSLAADAIHGAAGVATMLYMLRGGPILALPALPDFGEFYLPINEFLAQLGVFVLIAIAVLFAVKTVRRVIRIGQI